MKPIAPNENKPLLPASLMLAAGLLTAGILLAAGCGGGGATQTVTQTTVKTVTRTVTVPDNTQTSTSDGGSDQTAAGPYATESAAVTYVEAQQEGMSALDPDTTWQPGATLHVIHATPMGGASYGGDFYFFFVNGYTVGNKTFTSASSDGPVDGTTYEVTYNVFMPADPHCCPSGGTNTVQFHWDGSQLVTVGSMQGAEMS